MELIHLLQDALKSYPLVTREQLNHLKQAWTSDLTRLSRMSFFKGRLSRNEQKKHYGLNKKIDFLSNLVDQVGEEPKSLGAILFQEVFPDEIYQAQVIADYLENQLIYEEGFLPMLMGMQLESFDPPQFAGCILYLLRQGYTAETLLQSGIFHRFFMNHYSNSEEISNVYRILASEDLQQEDCYGEIFKLLQNTTAIRASKRKIMRQHALNGETSHWFIPCKVESPRFLPSNSKQNLNSLYLIFGQAFYVYLLGRRTPFINNVMETWLKETTQKMGPQVLKRIYRFINTKIAEEKRVRLLDKFGSFLKLDQVRPLLLDSEVAWMVLVSMEALLDKQPKQYLEQLSVLPITTTNYRYAALYTEAYVLQSYLKPILFQFFQLFLKQPSLVDDEMEPIVLKLQKFPETFEWCSMEIQLLRDELEQCICAENSLNLERYQLIFDRYRRHSSKTSLLMSLTNQNLHYPCNDFQLQALIIHLLFKLDPAIDIHACLNLMHSEEQYRLNHYSKESLTLAKCRTLYQVLADVDDQELHRSIIDLLTTSFNMPYWHDQRLSDGSFLRDRALQNGNESILNFYFSKDMEDETRMQVLHDIETDLLKRKNQNVLHFVSQNPQALKAALLLYPEHMRSEILTRRDGQDRTIFDLISSLPHALEVVISVLPAHERAHWLAEEIVSSNRTVLHYLQHASQVLQQVLYHLSEQERYQILKKKFHGQPIFLHHLAKSHPEAFFAAFETLTRHQKIDALALNDSRFGSLAFYLSDIACVDFLNILIKMTEHEQSRVLSLRNSDYMPLVHYLFADHLEVMQDFWQSLSESLRLQILGIYDEENLNLLEFSIRYYPKALIFILNPFSEAKREALLLRNDEYGFNLMSLIADSYRVDLLHVVLSLLPGKSFLVWDKPKMYVSFTTDSLDLSHRIPRDKTAREVLELLKTIPPHIRHLDLSNIELHPQEQQKFSPKNILKAIPISVQYVAFEGHTFKNIQYLPKARHFSNVEPTFFNRESYHGGLHRMNSTGNLSPNL
ncbi:hypothetical protein [Legionella yabuuchiae]|uniref:hypothetical protein n=1 Tax=Legionella yabuuchiae TaxID=376727 RepID=UPI001056762F|nr:hypothetical protein [Legionella yabuuchiae]